MNIRHLLLALSLAPALLHAQTSLPPAEQQIASAVLALPQEFRADAHVLGYRSDSAQLVALREGKGPFTCIANDPAAKEFHVACYHQSLEPFMSRGRALRASGVKGEMVDSARFAEVRTGKLEMPKQAATLYSVFGPAGAFDAAAGTFRNTRTLYVIYMPGATAASTGLSAKPAQGTPWIMFPGTPKAHIMFTPRM